MCDNNTFPHKAQIVVDCFEDPWIGRPDRRNGQRCPPFNIICGTYIPECLMTYTKSNCSVEGWHRKFETEVGANCGKLS